MPARRSSRSSLHPSALTLTLGLAGIVACGADKRSGSDVAAETKQPPATPEQPATPELPGAGGPGSSTSPLAKRLPAPPDAFANGDVDVVTAVKVADDRKPISPLIYGMNSIRTEPEPSDVMAGVTFVRRGGDRCNAYNWETNVSNGSYATDFGNDMYLASELASPNAPGELDRALVAANRAAGRGTMIPFVMNEYVAGPIAADVPYDTPGWDIGRYFRRVELVKPTPFAATPALDDGVVYTDEHIDFLRRRFPDDIYAPGPTQVMIGTDNEPDLFGFNFPMLQRGGGAPLYAANGVEIGRRITGTEFTAKFVTFATRVRQIAKDAQIVGPDHYHYDGWTTWHATMNEYTDAGRWYMDDFLETVRAASEAVGTRLLDTWDFHWYPQRIFDGTFTWALDHAARPMTADEIEAVLQGPRSYWDHDYDEQSWITNDHLFGPAFILERLANRIARGYPGTKLGVTEYFPGGCAHVSSGLATVESLGVFGRMGIHVAAMWPHTCDLRYAFGGFKLVRNADNRGLRFADTSVRVDHPEKVESGVYAAGDDELVTVLVVNKTNAPRSFGLRIFDAMPLEHVDVYRIDADHPNPYLAAQETLTKTNAYAYAAPPLSAALLVFRAR
jgi:hypothetical protein